MPNYKIRASLRKHFYTIITADSAEEAKDEAEIIDDWCEIVEDQYFSIGEVEELEDIDEP